MQPVSLSHPRPTPSNSPKGRPDGGKGDESGQASPRFSKSSARRRFRPNQEKVLSTRRCGRRTIIAGVRTDQLEPTKAPAYLVKDNLASSRSWIAADWTTTRHHKLDIGDALASVLKQDGRVDHFRNLNWKRTFLSKTRYMGGRQCSKRLWHTVYDPEPEEEALPGTVIGMGIEVGIKARLLWLGGVLVDTKYDQAEAIRRTKALIADPNVPAIFEAALVHDGVLIRVDALERLPDGRWRLNEVKSSTRIKNEHLEEVALQAYVIAGNGLDLAGAYLQDVSENLIPFLEHVPERIAEMHAVLSLREAPDIRPSRHCFRPHDCEFWKRCTVEKPKDWVFYISSYLLGEL